MVQIILFTCNMNFQPNNQNSEGKNHMTHSSPSLDLGKPSASPATCLIQLPSLTAMSMGPPLHVWFNLLVTLMANLEETHSVLQVPLHPTYISYNNLHLQNILHI